MEKLDKERTCNRQTTTASTNSVGIFSEQQARTFVTAAATRCPKCQKGNLDFGGIEIEGRSAFQEASCQDCDTRFYAVYGLVGFGLQGNDGTDVHTIAKDFGEIQKNQSKLHSDCESTDPSLDLTSQTAL